MAVTVTPPLRGVTAPLTRLVALALAPERARAGEIAIVLTDDAALRDLNRRYRRIDRATDVLSFDYDDPSPTPALLAGAGVGRGRRDVSGDLVISLDRMRAQARRFRVSEGRELARLVIHGALHLAGLDHHRLAERRDMRAREEHALVRGRAAITALDRALAGAGRPARSGESRE
jgi:probable rRNA maturation factor